MDIRWPRSFWSEIDMIFTLERIRNQANQVDKPESDPAVPESSSSQAVTSDTSSDQTA